MLTTRDIENNGNFGDRAGSLHLRGRAVCKKGISLLAAARTRIRLDYVTMVYEDSDRNQDFSF